MGRARAKEKVLARNKLKIERKAVKQEEKLKQKKEKERQEAELMVVRQQQIDVGKTKDEPISGTMRGPEDKRKEKVPLVEPFGVTQKKDSHNVIPNPNHVFIHKPWKETYFYTEKDQTVGSMTSMSTCTNLLLEDIFRPDEIRSLVELLNEPPFKESTLSGIHLSEITPGFAAVALNRFDIIKRLIKDGQFSSNYSNKGATPFACAIIVQNWDIIEFLLEKDYHAHDVDKFGNTNLLQAVLSSEWNEMTMVDLWKVLQCDLRTDIVTGNNVGLTLIHALAWRGWHEVMDDVLPLNPITLDEKSKLLDLVNAQTKDGITPLMFALMRGNSCAAQLLIARGAGIIELDKINLSPMCYAIDHMWKEDVLEDIEPEIMTSISSACEIIIMALNDPECSLDARNYAYKRLQVILNPHFVDQNHLDTFYRVGRAVFGFIVRFLDGGIDLLLDMRIFHKLATGGRMYAHDREFITTIFGILFDVLVFAENIRPSYSKVCNSFMSDGISDFCLQIIERENDTFTDEEVIAAKVPSSITSRSSTTAISNRLIGCLGIMVPEPKNKIYYNNKMAAIMLFIQLIDSPQLQPWFQTNFHRLKSGYEKCQHLRHRSHILSCNLDNETLIRTRKKVILFELQLNCKTWSSIPELISLHLKNLNSRYDDQSKTTTGSEVSTKSLK